MKEFRFQSETCVPRPRSEVFPFFAEARKLQELTPPWLKFEVLTPAPIVMRAGALIDYRITVHGLLIFWRTEIADDADPTSPLALQPTAWCASRALCDLA